MGQATQYSQLASPQEEAHLKEDGPWSHGDWATEG